jgi:hypothetical protein
VRPPTRLLASGRVAVCTLCLCKVITCVSWVWTGAGGQQSVRRHPLLSLLRPRVGARLRAGRLCALRRGAAVVAAGVRAPCAERVAAALVDGAQPAPRRAQQERGGGGGGLAVAVAGRWRCRSRQWVPGRCAAAPCRSLEQLCSVLRSGCHRTACRCMLAPRVHLRGTS